MLELAIFCFGVVASLLVSIFAWVSVKELRRIGELQAAAAPGDTAVEWMPAGARPPKSSP